MSDKLVKTLRSIAPFVTADDTADHWALRRETANAIEQTETLLNDVVRAGTSHIPAEIAALATLIVSGHPSPTMVVQRLRGELAEITMDPVSDRRFLLRQAADRLERLMSFVALMTPTLDRKTILLARLILDSEKFGDPSSHVARLTGFARLISGDAIDHINDDLTWRAKEILADRGSKAA